MTKLAGSQLSLIAESDFEDRPVGDWEFDELGTDKNKGHNFGSEKLGTEKIKGHNFDIQKLGTEKIKGHNFGKALVLTDPKIEVADNIWKPPVGGLDRKWIKDHQYWCWRYYDLKGVKRSIHLHKDYNKAVRKAIKIGMPNEAKLPKSTAVKTDPQISYQSTENIIDIAQTAHGTSRCTRAA